MLYLEVYWGISKLLSVEAIRPLPPLFTTISVKGERKRRKASCFGTLPRASDTPSLLLHITACHSSILPHCLPSSSSSFFSPTFSSSSSSSSLFYAPSSFPCFPFHFITFLFQLIISPLSLSPIHHISPFTLSPLSSPPLLRFLSPSSLQHFPRSHYFPLPFYCTAFSHLVLRLFFFLVIVYYYRHLYFLIKFIYFLTQTVQRFYFLFIIEVAVNS